MKHIFPLILLLCSPAVSRAQEPAPHFATGFRIGEVSQDRAISWGRITAQSERNWDGLVHAPTMSPTRVFVTSPDVAVSAWEGAVPGQSGRLRAGASSTPDMRDARW